jgi:hypothetical protein
MTDPTVIITFSCALISLIGSLLILLSYYIASTTVKPRAAILIRNLAFSDSLWFCCVIIESMFWLTNNTVPNYLCYVVSPALNFFRMSSLVWTASISFNLLMLLSTRKWMWKEEEKKWVTYRAYYYIIYILLAAPLPLVNIIIQHEDNGASDAGCLSGYERIGSWWEIFVIEALPIFLVFMFNVYVCISVQRKMSENVYPNSVRKKRRRVMYHYAIVFLLCWAPTIVCYFMQIFDLNVYEFQVFSRASLYLSGFFNFMVFGMQVSIDIHSQPIFASISMFLLLCHCTGSPFTKIYACHCLEFCELYISRIQFACVFSSKARCRKVCHV